MRIVPQDAIGQLLDVASTLDVNALALHSLHHGQSQVPQRIVLDLPSGPSFFMPASFVGGGNASDTLGTLGMKIVSVKPGNNPPVTGTLIVMNPDTGALEGLVDAEESTAWRTAAGSALSALVFYHERPAPKSLVVFGAGPQAHAHILMLLHLFPLSSVTVIGGRSQEKIDSLISHFKHDHPTVSFHGLLANDAEISIKLREADLIATCTPSTTSLFDGSLPKPGSHIMCVGSYRPTVREIDETLVNRAWCLACDSKAAVMKEAGEVQPIKGTEGEARVVDLGALYELAMGTDKHIVPKKADIEVLKTRAGKGEGDVSIYKSVGVAVQDVFMGQMLLKAATVRGIGTVV
jgi:ornithine cyclodeaminase